MVRKYIKKLSGTFVLAALILCMNVTAFAAKFSDIDFGKDDCSIVITLEQGGKHGPVEGIQFALYRVAYLENEGNEPGYHYLKEFDKNGMKPEDLQDKDLAGHLAAVAADQKLDGIAGKTDAKGRLKWNDLELGVYLIAQIDRAEGDYVIAPFLVTIPLQSSDGTSWIYDVNATPKLGWSDVPETDTPETEPPKTEKPPTPPLIQTGQMNWPIPILAGSGILIFAMGWYLTFIKKEK